MSNIENKSIKLNRIGADVQSILTKECGNRKPVFVLVYMDPAGLVADYVSNASRMDAIKLLKEMSGQLEGRLG